MTVAGGAVNARPLCRCHQEPMVKNGMQSRGPRVQGWRCAAKIRERNARRVRLCVGLGLRLYLGHASTPEAHEFSTTLIRQRKEELHGCIQ